jgi:hypothetical protein
VVYVLRNADCILLANPMAPRWTHCIVPGNSSEFQWEDVPVHSVMIADLVFHREFYNSNAHHHPSTSSSYLTVKDGTSVHASQSIPARYETDFLRICTDFVCFHAFSRGLEFLGISHVKCECLIRFLVFSATFRQSASAIIVQSVSFLIFTFCIMCHIASCLHSEDWSAMTVLFLNCDLRTDFTLLYVFVDSMRTYIPRAFSLGLSMLSICLCLSISICLAHLFGACWWPLLESIESISVVSRRVQDSLSIITILHCKSPSIRICNRISWWLNVVIFN